MIGGGPGIFYRKSYLDKQNKDGDYNECPKCGRQMEIAFNVRKCPNCDFKNTEKNAKDEEERKKTQSNKDYYWESRLK